MLFLDSLLAALSPFTLLMNFMGVMLGMIVGALPGLGSVVAITICLPFTFGMTSVSAIALSLIHISTCLSRRTASRTACAKWRPSRSLKPSA